MRTSFRVAALLLCAAIIMSLAGCFQDDSAEAADADAAYAQLSPQEEAVARYQHAAESVLSAQNLTFTVTTETTTTVGSEVFTRNSQQDITYLDQNTDSMCAYVQETVTIGNYKVDIQESYLDGTGYFTVGDAPFCTTLSPAVYRARFAPAVLLDASLYAEAAVQLLEDGAVISFNAPAAAESWAVPADAQLISAAGQASVSADGALTECTYKVAYQYGSASIEKNITLTIGTTSLSSIEAPANAGEYVTLDDPDAPRLLEEACGYLMQAQSVSASTTDSIVSEAFGIYRTQTSQLYMHGADSGLLALRHTNVNLVNHSLGGEASDSKQTERFQDGVYTISTDGSEPAAQPEITADKMRTYGQELLVGSILLPEYIVSAASSETDTGCRLDFMASEELAQLLGSNACKTLYDNPQLLNDLASAYQTNAMTAYLEIDKFTGLPIAAGIHYSGTHTIQDTAYVLTYQTEQTYDLTSGTAYDTILQESTAPTQEPATEASTETTA